MTERFRKQVSGKTDFTGIEVQNCSQTLITQQDFNDAKKIISLFGGNPDNIKSKNRWTKNNLPKILINLTNLIDLNYNFTSEEKYHLAHFSDIKNVSQNTPGFVACHMFAEYLCITGKAITYKNALELIQSGPDKSTLTKVDWYVGHSYANTTWRQAAIYRNRCTELDWLKPFGQIYYDKSELETLAEDTVQLMMCAKLLIIYLTNEKLITLPKVNGELIDGKERVTVIADFPDGEIRTFASELKNFYDEKKKAKIGGRRKPKNKPSSSSGHTPTKKRVMIGGNSRVVYSGKRGGEYVKKGGEFIPLAKAMNSTK
jgi:hypothetical protein